MTSRPTILVVDDDADIRAILTLAFEHHGFQVLTAVDGVDALLQLERERPAVIVLDLMMPRMTGLEFRREQLRRPEYAGIRVVYMSAAPEAYSDLFAQNGCMCIGKPFNIDEVVATVAQLCGCTDAGPKITA